VEKDRLDIFRAYMAQFDAAADPVRAIDRGQYVASARALADRVRPRVELEPHATHLLTGGVGSGKTTQLLVMRDAIAKLPDTTAIYIDVTQRQDLRHIRSGVLLLLAGEEVERLLPSRVTEDVEQARTLLRRRIKGSGYWRPDDEPFCDDEPPDHDDGSPGHYVHVPGELVPPPGPGPLTFGTSARLEIVKTLREAARPKHEHMVILFDGLDRMRDVAKFRELVEQDVQALRSASIGVVLVGPIDVIYAKEKATRDLFDATWHLSPVDLADPEGRRFLMQILRKRASEHVLPDEVCARLAERSGGVLRDLIKLARSAGYEAYAAGADRVGLEHVEAAADAQGRAQLQAVGHDGLEVLQRVRTKGTFIPTSDRDLALLASRNVLEYQDGAKIRYAVHPAIEPLLAGLAAP
jgi:energy-coupling factor transporter ATP-binding protein EcfA2